MTAGSGVIVALSVWHVSGSVRVTAVHFSCYEILHSPYFSKFLKIVLFCSQTGVNLTNTLFTAFRNFLIEIWNRTSRMLLFRLPSMRGLFLYSHAPKLQNVRVQIWHTRKPQSGLCRLQKTLRTRVQNCLKYALLHCLAEKMCKFSCNPSGVKNGDRTRVIIYRCELWSQKKNGPHIPGCTYSLKGTSVISCNEHSWVNVGISAVRTVTITLSVFTCPLRLNRASSLNGMSVISQFIQHSPHEATISQNSVLLHDLHGRGWVGPQSYMDSVQLFVTFCASDADKPACCGRDPENAFNPASSSY